MMHHLERVLDKDITLSIAVRTSLRQVWKARVLHPWQRVRRGYSYQDLWSLDWYLNSVLAEALPELATKGSYIPLTKDYEVDWKKGKHKHYQRMMMEMAAGFQLARDLNHDGKDPDEEQQQIIDRSWELLREFHGSLWW